MTRTSKGFRLAAAVAGVALLLGACGSDDDDSDGAAATSTAATGTSAPGATTAPTTTKPTNTEPIKVGALYDLTGPLSALGDPAAKGAQAYIDQLNKDGGINGRQVKLTVYNSESTSDAAIAGMRELIRNGNVAILGPPSGTTANAVLPIANEAKIPVLSPQGALNLGEGYMFTTSLAGSRTLSNFAKFFVDEGIKKVGWLVAGDALGQTQSGLARPIFAEAKLEIVGEQTINPTAADYTTQLSALKQAGAQAVYVIASGAAVVTAAKGFAALDMPGFILLQNASLAQVELFGDAASRVRVPQPKVAVFDQIDKNDPLAPAIQRFIQVGSAAGVPIDLFGAGGFSGARIITDTIKKVGDDPKAIHDAWTAGFKDDANLAGSISWTKTDHGCCGLNAWTWAVPDPAGKRFKVLRPAA